MKPRKTINSDECYGGRCNCVMHPSGWCPPGTWCDREWGSPTYDTCVAGSKSGGQTRSGGSGGGYDPSIEPFVPGNYSGRVEIRNASFAQIVAGASRMGKAIPLGWLYEAFNVPPHIHKNIACEVEAQNPKHIEMHFKRGDISDWDNLEAVA